ncbi:hypothetical protein Tco_0531559 [Tanacetum coccineum]
MIEHDGRACIYGAFVSVDTNVFFMNDEFPILDVGRKIISEDNDISTCHERCLDGMIRKLTDAGKPTQARILELKRRNMKKTDSDIQYAVSIKEDTAYLCLHFTKDHEGNKINTPYPENPIRRIQVIECEDCGRY